MSATLEEMIALGSSIGRQAAADLFGESHLDLRAFGMANDALEDGEQVIKRIDARLGAGQGSRIAYALRQGMAMRLADAEAATKRDANQEAAQRLLPPRRKTLRGQTGVG